MIPVSAPPRVHRRLHAADDGPVPVVHRSRDAVYVDVAGRCVGVLGRRATAVPCGLRSGLDVLPDVGRAHVAGGMLHLDGEPVAVGRLHDVTVPRLPGRARSAAPPPGDVTGTIGSGGGLTPYQDDVVCGWLAAHRAAGVPTPAVDAAVRRSLHRTTLLSATLLECTLLGEVLPELAAWLADPTDHEAADRLLAVGHSSGRGLLEGARAALRALGPPAVAA